MSANDDAFFTWTRDTARCLWPGARVDRIDALRGDASTRRFWRVHLADGGAPTSAILVDLGPHDLPPYARTLKLVPDPLQEPPWLTVHRLLSRIGAPVPAVYDADPAHRAMLVEDAGETSLFDAVRKWPSGAADLFRSAVELLMLFHVDGTRALQPDFLSAKIAYDQHLFRWELKEFLELGCSALANADPASLAPELDALAAELGRLPRVFSHRDFHGQNLFVQPVPDGVKLRVIDFQDALMAPAAQDLAVLLTTRDTAKMVPPALERRLLDFYYTGLGRREAATLSHDEFLRSYQLCVLQHALKMMGRFMLFERDGRRGYAAFVPHVIAQGRRILSGPAGQSFPLLVAAFDAPPTVEARR
ncbi:MAG TPA: phosphotransferase [Candidatus Binataceae bacterium]|nr:phosphotransferase [Candidatus Binataceae bacterium]